MARFNPFAVLKHLWNRLFGRRKRFSGYPTQARSTSTWVIGQPGMGKEQIS
ncbi:MAG: hypothetical protein R3E39_06435 [Anaerolineae bacterium]